MRVCAKIGLTITVVLAGLTIYEIPRARLVWRCSRMALNAKRKFADRAAVSAVVTDEITAADPEAADILRYCLGEPNEGDLSHMVAMYPQNEFFLAQMAHKLTEVNLIDDRASLVFADRLIALNPDNAHYRYIKGWILLKPPRDIGREQDAIEQFELGNGLNEFYLPYSNFKQRVDRISDKAGISPLGIRRAEPSETGVYWDLVKLVPREYGVYPRLDRELFARLSAAVAQVAERLMNNARHDGHLNHGDVLLASCEGTRLRYLDLSPAEAQQTRFRLGRSEEIGDILGDCMVAVWAVIAELMMIALVVGVFTVFLLPLSLPFVWLFLVIVNGLRGGAKDASVGFVTPILFVTGLTGYFGMAVLYGVSSRLLGGRFLAAIAFVAAAIVLWICIVLWAHIRTLDCTRSERSRLWVSRICKVFWILGAIADAVICSFVLAGAGIAKWFMFVVVLVGWSAFCTVVLGVTAFRHDISRIIAYRGLVRNRFRQIVFVLLPMTGILGLFRPVPVVPWILAFFTILLVGFVSAHAPVGLLASLDGVSRIFSRESHIVIARTKVARIMSTILFLVWIVLLVGVHLSADKWSRMNKILTDPLADHRPLPQANRETYERVLSRKYSDAPDANPRAGFKEDVGLPMEFHLASPEYLYAVLAERRMLGKPVRAKMLLELMRRGGHDIRPMVVKALKDPNALDVLIRRAKWEDASVKDRLEHVFQDKLFELAETIAPVREDPDSIRSLVIRSDRGDKAAQRKLARTAQTKLLELFERIYGGDNSGELQTELMALQEIDSVLYRTSRVRQLIIDANMPELLEHAPRTGASGRDVLTSLLDIAGALAFISVPQEAEARFSRVMNVASPTEDDANGPDLQQPASTLLKVWAGDHRESLFCKDLAGVPRPNVTALLKKYVHRRQLTSPFKVLDFLHVFSRAGDRELAEWLFRCIAKSRPIVLVSDYPDLVPTLQPINISDVKAMRVTKRSKDMTDRYLEPIFPHLDVESIPLLLEHLDCDNDQLRAFIVWRVTSLGYEWPEERLASLRQDNYWKVRMNALFACDKDDLSSSIEDGNPLIRTVTRMLIQADAQ